MPPVERQIRFRSNVNTYGHGSQSIVWAHGFGSDQRVWRNQIDAFRNSFRCVVFDQTGATEASAERFAQAKFRTVQGFAEDLADITLYFAGPGAILVGHSMGAMVGVLAALRRPGLFSKLVLIAGAPRYLHDENFAGAYGQSELNMLYRQIDERYEDWVAEFPAQVIRNANRPELTDCMSEILNGLRSDIALATLSMILQADFRAELSRITTPTMIIQPLRDPIVPVSVGRFMRQQIPQSKLIEIDVEGHWPHLANPELINGILANEFGVTAVDSARGAAGGG